MLARPDAQEPPLETLLTDFESIGDNCEFGLVQRRYGAEPYGLLRWAFATLPSLLDALTCRFEGVEDVEIIERADAYDGRMRRYGWGYHSSVLPSTMAPEQVARVLSRRNSLLREALIDHLEQADRLFVRKSNAPHSEAEIEDLVAAMGRYGASTLLWVVPATTPEQAGTVERLGPRLLRGYIDQFAPYANAHRISLECWSTICRAAHRLWRSGERPAADVVAVAPQAPPRLRLDLTRGRVVLSRVDGAVLPEAGLGRLLRIGRASPGAWIDAHARLHLAEPDDPRFDHTPLGKPIGLLLEPASANLLTGADDFAGGWAPWEDAWSDPSREVPPLRHRAVVMRHRRARQGEDMVFHRFIPGGITPETIICMSLYVWVPASFRGTRVEAVFSGFYSVGAVPADLARRDCWQRTWCAALVPEARTVAHPALTVEGDAGATVFSTCWQLEERTRPTSYIPTGDAPATRAADTAVSEGTGLAWPPAEGGTLVWEGSLPTAPDRPCDLLRFFSAAQRDLALRLTAGPSLGAAVGVAGGAEAAVSGSLLLHGNPFVRVVIRLDRERLSYADSSGVVAQMPLAAPLAAPLSAFDFAAAEPVHHRSVLLFDGTDIELGPLLDMARPL